VRSSGFVSACPPAGLASIGANLGSGSSPGGEVGFEGGEVIFFVGVERSGLRRSMRDSTGKKKVVIAESILCFTFLFSTFSLSRGSGDWPRRASLLFGSREPLKLTHCAVIGVALEPPPLK